MRALLAASFLLVVACAPDLSIKTSRVTRTRVVAVRAEPAEAKPNANVHWTAIVVSPSGAPMDVTIDWNFCLVPRAPTDPASIATECIGAPLDVGEGGLADDAAPTDAGTFPDGAAPVDAGPVLIPVMGSGHGDVSARIPADACSKVGPQVPPAAADGTRQRPPDPDITGGYYLPIRLSLADDTGYDTSFARQRLRCALPDLPSQTATDYAAQYHNNTNPSFEAAGGVTVGDVDAPNDGAVLTVPFSAPMPIVVQWTPESIEDYVVVDPATRLLVPRTETFTVEWFTNGGDFDHDRTVSYDYLYSTSTLRIDADRTDPVTVWIVLRDDRGGVDYRVIVLSPM